MSAASPALRPEEEPRRVIRLIMVLTWLPFEKAATLVKIQTLGEDNLCPAWEPGFEGNRIAV
jgi:hypothetical protein